MSLEIKKMKEYPFSISSEGSIQFSGNSHIFNLHLKCGFVSFELKHSDIISFPGVFLDSFETRARM